jgi:putative ABC transport system permease protein
VNQYQAFKLAWANTSEDWRRLAIRCAGITFAVVLMFMQNGFRNALFDSNIRIAENINFDFIIRTKTRFMLSSGQLMPADKIQIAANVPGVVQVEPFYIETIASYLRRIGQPARRLRVLAFDVSKPMFDQLNLQPFILALQNPGSGIGDRKSKSIFGFNDVNCRETTDSYGELAGKAIHLAGCFELGIDFSNNGNLIMTPENFSHYFPHRGNGRPLEWVDYGLIRCGPDSDRARILADLKSFLDPHVIVNSKQEFLESEREFWGNRTPIGLIFSVGTMIGFIVGSIICYQVLATDIADHLSEFATLKAMGYTTRFFAMVVVNQALLLSLISFLPGLLISLTLFYLVNQISGLLMSMDFWRGSYVLCLTVAMCVASATIALRRLISNDPANLF